MAAKAGAWGIDIGQSGLKAIRLEVNDATEQVVAVAFDYIAHPKILSQPDAMPEELIAQALEKFLKQNDIGNDAVGISVPGQSALARFIQLPPVESSKVSEIVKYEARQQIPFQLDDVVWDYQTLGKGSEESGFLLEAEVGLFAMKRDQVMNQLRPFTNADIEVDLIQIAPLALYNFLTFDQLGMRLGDDIVAMDAYSILLDMGADNTTLLVSNGQKIWIRNVPIGGNHFTRALTKEMKLTFAKAEHLKCNATKSPDPRAVFQALRPVFNDYVSEIQRSIGYFSSVNREAKIAKVVGLGNGFKLAGLQKFLQQNLQYEVERIDSYSAISSDGFKDPALFEENILSFPICYGVALQALKQTRIRTSLLPREITTARTITRKKPWAVAAGALLMAGLATSAFGFARARQSVSKDIWGKPHEAVEKIRSEALAVKTAYSTERSKNGTILTGGANLLKALGGRTKWIELYKAIDDCLPRDPEGSNVADIREQRALRIEKIQARWEPNLTDWLKGLDPGHVSIYMSPEDNNAPLTGGGLVVTVTGISFHNEGAVAGATKNVPTTEEALRQELGRGAPYINESFVKNLQKWSVPARDGSGEVGVRAVGINHAVLATHAMETQRLDPYGRTEPRAMRGSLGSMNTGGANRKDRGGVSAARENMRQQREMMDKLQNRAGGGEPGTANGQGPIQSIPIEVTNFAVQFVWTPDARPAKPAAPVAHAAAAAAPGAASGKPGTSAPAPVKTPGQK